MLSASTVRIAYLKILERKMGSAYVVDKWVRKVRIPWSVEGLFNGLSLITILIVHFDCPF